MLFAQDARARHVATIGASASEFKKRLKNNELYANVTCALWNDGLYPILQRELIPVADAAISSHGTIVWKSVTTDERLQENLREFVKQESSRRFSDGSATATANQCFSRICHRKYNGFLLILAQLLQWEADESPSIIVFGEERVRGTQDLMPTNNRPRTKFDALFDPRPCFNAIRQGFLEHYGRNLLVVKNEVENALSNFCTDLRTDPAIVELNAAIIDVVTRQMSECSATPPRFIDDVWPHYLHALEHGDGGRSYWLSYDELLAVAIISNVKLIVVEERDDGFYYQGSTFEHCLSTNSEEPIIVSIRGGGKLRVESHFERLVSQTTLELRDRTVVAASSSMQREGHAIAIENGLSKQPRGREQEADGIGKIKRELDSP